MGVSSRVREVQRQFLRYAGPLRAFVLGLLADRELADDVVQETFVTLSQRADQYEPGTNILAGARATAGLKAFEVLRRRERFPDLLDEPALVALADQADDLSDRWDAHRAALEACLEQLAPSARRIVALRYADDRLDLLAIARKVGWTVGAVKVALSRARQTLRDCVAGKLPEV